ncbi:NAD(P)/FAD-dependent oxidoreductase [Pigmentiphaga sp. CHJ604]|uniref:FAD-dependent oxidoreductase n=1 Tax=Pigmentiphaga sp. CHJ604 TaxID=3081984 RepID=UPI0030CF61C4
MSKHIAIVGAGPVGVVAALAAVQQGFRVSLYEAESRVDDSPRAATTHSSTLEMIARVGLIDRFVKEGLTARYFQFWDQAAQSMVAQFDHEILKDDTPYPFVVQTEQHKLGNMGIEKLRTYADAAAHFEHRITAVAQSGDGVTLTAQAPGGEVRIEADYVIAADGGRSALRKALDIPFEGMTWPERFIVITVKDDFERLMGCCYRNYLAHPDAWTNLFKISGDDMQGRWRAVFPSGVDETDEEALSDAAVARRLAHVFPRAEPYEVLHRNIYRVHQRVAARFRQGRVFLAGDAAHVNNPIGGLGLNCGIHDAMELVDMLAAVERGEEDASVFDRYERRRRQMNIEFVQQQTVNNKKRLEEKDPAVRAQALDDIRRIADDPQRHRQFLLRSSLIDSVRKARTIA